MSEPTKRQFARPPGYWRQDGTNAFMLATIDQFVFRYELVRRISKLLDEGEIKDLLKADQLRQLQKAKPFKSLGFLEQQIMLYQFYLDSGERPVTATSRYLMDQFGGYSESFPSLHFDLHASDPAISQTVLAWINEQRRQSGVVRSTNLGPKGGSSRNTVQNYKAASWHLIGWLDAPKDHKLKSKGGLSHRRRRLREEAINSLRTVITGLKRIAEDAKKFRRYYCTFPE